MSANGGFFLGLRWISCHDARLKRFPRHRSVLKQDNQLFPVYVGLVPDSKRAHVLVQTTSSMTCNAFTVHLPHSPWAERILWSTFFSLIIFHECLVYLICLVFLGGNTGWKTIWTSIELTRALWSSMSFNSILGLSRSTIKVNFVSSMAGLINLSQI